MIGLKLQQYDNVQLEYTNNNLYSKLPGINVNSLVALFGKFVKFYVDKDSAFQNSPPSATGEQPNAFQILMASQAHRSTQTSTMCG